jgi:hypothetical protein
VTAEYLSAVDPAEHGGVIQIADEAPRIGTGSARFKRVRLLNPDDAQTTGSLLLNQPIVLEATLDVTETIEEAILEVGIAAIDGLRLVTAFNTDGGREPVRLEPGVHELRAELAPALLPGAFVLDLGVHERVTGAAVDLVERVLQFDVGVSDGEGETYAATVRGYLRAETRWEVGAAAPVDS